jgi:tyrosyl-tRNA synthetase
VSKTHRTSGTQLGTWGERVARERAARRRAAKERAALEMAAPAPTGSVEIADVAPVRRQPEPEPPSSHEPETIEIPHSDLANELSVLAAVVTGGLARSHTEAKRLLRDEGISVNGAAVLSDKAKLTLADVTAEGVIAVTVGASRGVVLKPI